MTALPEPPPVLPPGPRLPTGVPPASLTAGLPNIPLRPLPPPEPDPPEPAAAPAPAPEPTPAAERRVWPLDGQNPRDLPAALEGVREVTDYLTRATHPATGITSADATALTALIYAITEITTCLPNLANRLAELVDQLGEDPTLTHTEAARGDTAATVIHEMLRTLATAEVSARSLHGQVSACRLLVAFLTHHHPGGHPHAA